MHRYLTDPKELKIRAGEWDTQTLKERLPYQERLVGRIFSHPSYNERSLANDVAIIELEDPFALADNVATICLPSQNYVSTSKNCFASGWGKDNFGKEGKFSAIMKRVELPIVPYVECQNRLKQTRLTEKFHLDPSFLCAGGQPGVDTCQVDLQFIFERKRAVLIMAKCNCRVMEELRSSVPSVTRLTIDTPKVESSRGASDATRHIRQFTQMSHWLATGSIRRFATLVWIRLTILITRPYLAISEWQLLQF